MKVDISHNIVSRHHNAIILQISGEYCVEWDNGTQYRWFKDYEQAQLFVFCEFYFFESPKL